MDKADPPTSFDVFKPVGHTVVAFASQAQVNSAISALLAQGFGRAALTCYTPEQMTRQVDAQEAAASPLAPFGYEIALIRMHRTLAQSGCSFLVVDAPDKTQALCVAKPARSMHAAAAQYYGRFMIQDLLEPIPGQSQIARAPRQGPNGAASAASNLFAVDLR